MKYLCGLKPQRGELRAAFTQQFFVSMQAAQR
jgi:hypothetical protein